MKYINKLAFLFFFVILSNIGNCQVSLSTLQSIVMLKGDNSSAISKEIKVILEPQGFKINDEGKWIKLSGDSSKETININLNAKGNAIAYEAINLPATKGIVLQIKEMENFVLVNDNGVNIRFKNSSNNFKYQVIYEGDYNRCMIAILNSPDQVKSVQPTSSIESDGNKTFQKVEVEAEFTGGISSWKKYLQANLNADVPVNNGAPLGAYTVIVRFIVSKTGEISDIVAETNHGYGMEKEVIRVIKKGPNWTPGIQDGKNVNSVRRQPIRFVVSESN